MAQLDFYTFFRELLRQILFLYFPDRGCDPNRRSRKEVDSMEEILTTFLVSVIAGVVSYYICKWLDSRR